MLRTSSGSLSIRTKWVGTHWLQVTWYFSIAASAPSVSNFLSITTVPPILWTVIEKRSGAA